MDAAVEFLDLAGGVLSVGHSVMIKGKGARWRAGPRTGYASLYVSLLPSFMTLRSRSIIFGTLATALLLAVAMATPAEAARRHLRLVKSTPAADTVLAASPAALELWFSEKVELGVTRVRLEGPDAKPVALGAVKFGATKPGATDEVPAVVATISAALAEGAHVVRWSTASRDGHVVKGEIAFTVRTR